MESVSFPVRRVRVRVFSFFSSPLEENGAHLDDASDFLPLILGRVDASRVVGAGVQEYDRLVRHLLQVLDHALEIESNRVLVVVPVARASRVEEASRERDKRATRERTGSAPRSNRSPS